MGQRPLGCVPISSPTSSSLFQTYLEIGPLLFQLKTASSSQIEEIRECYGPFVPRRRSGRRLWTLRLRPYKRQKHSRNPLVRRRKNSLSLSWSRFRGRVDLLSRTGDIRLESVAVLGTFLRTLISQVLILDKGFLMHSAGMIDRGNTFLFTGPSGAGKSTISRLCTPRRLLSDEIILLHRSASRWQAYGTPFVGELPHCLKAQGPLKALYFLEKDKRWKALPLQGASSARRLLRNILFFGTDGDSHERLLNNITSLINTVPSYRLRFAKTLPRGKKSLRACLK